MTWNCGPGLRDRLRLLARALVEEDVQLRLLGCECLDRLRQHGRVVDLSLFTFVGR